MKTAKFHQFTLAIVITLLSCCSFAQDALSYGRFGKLTIYHPPVEANNLVLFVSGDGGWQYGVINMARFLAEQGALVVGIDAKQYRANLAHQKQGCLYPAGDFEQLSMMLQKKYHFAEYRKPILAGYSYGATLIYGLLAQAPTGTFRGGISLGFAPDIELPAPLCKGAGLPFHTVKGKKGYFMDPVEELPAPMIALNGMVDQSSDYKTAVNFFKGMRNAQLISLPKVGHGFSIADNWLPQFKMAYEELKPPVDHLETKHHLPPTVQTNMPIKVYPAQSADSHSLIFMLSGDGGWTSFDQGLAQALSKKNSTVIGLDTQKYFWKAKKPEEAANAINQILAHFIKNDPSISITLVGFSFGACVTPFIYNKIPASTKAAIKDMVLLSPDKNGDFEIHVADMLSFGSSQQPYDVLAELKRTNGVKKLCIFGDTEDKEVTQSFRQAGTAVTVLPGGHHYNNDYNTLVHTILNTH